MNHQLHIPWFSACPSNNSAIGAVNDMRLQLLQYLFTLRYYKNSMPCAKGYTENENKIIAYLQSGGWYHLNTINTKEEIYYVLYVNEYI